MGGEELSRRPRIPHVPALDGLRGLAVAGVLFFHGGHLVGGYLGVDFFFVLSGFLITSLLLAESKVTGSIGLGGFWARRARRLLPALAGVLLGVAIYCIVFADPSELAQIRGDAFATIGYVANWRSLASGQDYWAIFRAPSPLEHTWSLAIEEQFYLVWPLVFVGLLAWWGRAAAARAVLVTSLVLAAVSTVLMFSLYHPGDPSRVYYGTDTRATGILLGASLAAALAVWGAARGRVARGAVEAAGLAGVAVLALAWTGLDGQSDTLYRGGFLVCGVAAIAVIAAVTHPQPGVLARVFSFGPLCALGLISYGVYLWHWPVDVVMTPDRVGLTGWPLFALQLVVTLAIAIVSYVLIEMPVRRGALPAIRWRALVPAIAVGLVALLFVTTAGSQPSAIASAAASTKRQEHLRRDHPGHTRVMILGDSAAYTLGPGVQRQARNRLQVVNGAVPGCSLDWQAQDLRRINNNPNWRPRNTKGCDWPVEWPRLIDRYQPDLVLLYFGLWDIGDHRVDGRELDYGTRAWRDHMTRIVDGAVAMLSRDGARVGILLNPQIPTELGVQPLNQVLRDAAKRLALPALDLERVVDRGGTKYRWDGNHYTPLGADAAGHRIVGWVLHLERTEQ